MTPQEKRKWEERVIADLTPDRNRLQAQLDEIRELRMNIGLKSRDSLREYRMKLGELSFTVGAAIVPVIIISDSKVKYIEYALVGVGLYLLTGLLLFWRSKTILYQDAEDAPQVGLDEELILEPILHAYNKVLHNPSSDDYRNEYINASKYLLDDSLAAQKKPRKPHADFSIDLGLFGFIAATLFVARTVWPFDSIYFWTTLCAFVALVVATLAFNYIQMRKTRNRIEDRSGRIISSREKYQEWHNREVLGK